jgi:hypothetical protein
MDEKTHRAEAGAALAGEGHVRYTIRRRELIAALGGACSRGRSWLARKEPANTDINTQSIQTLIRNRVCILV